MKKIIYYLFIAQILFYCGCSAGAEQSEFPFYAFDGDYRGKQIGLLIPVESSGVLKMFVSIDKIKPGNYNLYLHDAQSCRSQKEVLSEDIIKAQFPLLEGGDGTIRIIIISRDLTMQDLRGRSLIIHATTENMQPDQSAEHNPTEASGHILPPVGKAVACVNIPHPKKR